MTTARRAARQRRAPRRDGEAGFTVLEAVLALAVTMTIALGAMQLFDASQRADRASAAMAEAAEAAEVALGRLGADLAIEEGVVEYETGPVSVRVTLTPLEAQFALLAPPAASESDGGEGGVSEDAFDQDAFDQEALDQEAFDAEALDDSSLLGGAPYAATALARHAEGPVARLETIVISPPQDEAGGDR